MPFFAVIQEIDKGILLKRDEKLLFNLDVKAFDHEMIHRMFEKKEAYQVEA